MTQCTQSSFEFQVHCSREVVARFDGGTISSDGGSLLLRQTDQRLNLLARFSNASWTDGNRIGWSIPFWRWFRNESTDWRSATKISTITSNCGKIRCSECWRDGKNSTNRLPARAR